MDLLSNNFPFFSNIFNKVLLENCYFKTSPTGNLCECIVCLRPSHMGEIGGVLKLNA